MLKAFYELPNAVSVTFSLIRKLNIQVSRYTVKHHLEEHPDYPSLLAIKDCLTSWNIPNQAFQFNKKKCIVEELPLPFIAHLKNDGGQLMLIHKILESKVYFNNEKVQNGVITRDEFLSRWDGILLYAEGHHTSGEVNYHHALIEGFFNYMRLPFMLAVVLSVILYSIDYGLVNWAYIALLCLKFSGILLSIMLLIYSVNSNNPFIQNLCSLGRKNGCNAILKSSAAQVTSWLSWSEVGFFYFSGSFIYLLINPSGVGFISLLNLLCLPYTLYSIGYQFKIKSICILCSFVQVVLWLEAVVHFWNDHSFNMTYSTFGFSTLGLPLLCFLFPIVLWSFIKPFFFNAQQVLPLKQQLKMFKYNSTLFNQLLTSQKKYEVSDDLMAITLGNPVAETIIIMVSNPFCRPCASVHKTLEEWITKNDNIQLKILFTTADHDNDNRTKVARHIIALSRVSDDDLVQRALNDWYSQHRKSYKNWSEDFPVKFSDEMNIVTKKQKEWCKMAEISFTPTILINGYKLIAPYKLEDIKYLLG